MDVYMVNEDGTAGPRMVLDVDEQIRIAALNAAIAYHKGDTISTIVMYADAFYTYIATGETPKPPAGTGVIW